MRFFTPDRKLREIERELRYRRSVYANLAENRADRKAELDERYAIMEAIAEDYKRLIASRSPQLALDAPARAEANHADWSRQAEKDWQDWQRIQQAQERDP